VRPSVVEQEEDAFANDTDGKGLNTGSELREDQIVTETKTVTDEKTNTTTTTTETYRADPTFDGAYVGRGTHLLIATLSATYQKCQHDMMRGPSGHPHNKWILDRSVSWNLDSPPYQPVFLELTWCCCAVASYHVLSLRRITWRA